MKYSVSQKKALSVVALAGIVFAVVPVTPALADTTLQGSTSKSKYQATGLKGYFQRHPKVKSATLGGGVGAGVGAVTGLISGKGTMRGAAIGAGTGVGVGLVSSSKTLDRHPLVKDTATGTLIGAGLGLAASRGHGKGKKVAAATAVGAALGLGTGFLKDKF